MVLSLNTTNFKKSHHLLHTIQTSSRDTTKKQSFTKNRKIPTNCRIILLEEVLMQKKVTTVVNTKPTNELKQSVAKDLQNDSKSNDETREFLIASYSGVK